MQPFPFPGSCQALARVCQLWFHMIQRWESTTHIRRPAQGCSAVECTALPAPMTASGAPCTRRCRSGHRGRVGASHPSSQTCSRRAGCIQVCGVLVSNPYYVKPLFFGDSRVIGAPNEWLRAVLGPQSLVIELGRLSFVSHHTWTKPREEKDAHPT
jgi:hypothetical protein